MPAEKPLSFQALILKLHDYWSRQGCVILQHFSHGSFQAESPLPPPFIFMKSNNEITYAGR